MVEKAHVDREGLLRLWDGAAACPCFNSNSSVSLVAFFLPFFAHGRTRVCFAVLCWSCTLHMHCLPWCHSHSPLSLVSGCVPPPSRFSTCTSFPCGCCDCQHPRECSRSDTQHSATSWLSRCHHSWPAWHENFERHSGVFACHAVAHADTDTDTHTHRHTRRQTDRQTDTHTHTRTHTSL